MTPERKVTLARHTIEQYYWAGEFPVYVNNRLTNLSFDRAVELARRAEESNAEIDALEAVFAKASAADKAD